MINCWKWCHAAEVWRYGKNIRWQSALYLPAFFTLPSQPSPVSRSFPNRLNPTSPSTKTFWLLFCHWYLPRFKNWPFISTLFSVWLFLTHGYLDSQTMTTLVVSCLGLCQRPFENLSSWFSFTCYFINTFDCGTNFQSRPVALHSSRERQLKLTLVIGILHNQILRPTVLHSVTGS